MLNSLQIYIKSKSISILNQLFVLPLHPLNELLLFNIYIIIKSLNKNLKAIFVYDIHLGLGFFENIFVRSKLHFAILLRSSSSSYYFLSSSYSLEKEKKKGRGLAISLESLV